MYRVFIIEDDVSLCRALCDGLSAWDFEVRAAEDLKDVLPEFTAFDPHLVLVDIRLPYYDGYHWCRRLRAISQVPVVFLSSTADNMNIIMAMTMGADDFIAKPVDLNVLTAKLQAILRRAYDMAGQRHVLMHRGLVLDPADGSVTVGETRVVLTRNEQCILQTLLERHGHIVSRSALMNALWQDDCYVEENTLTVNVARLRKKLEATGLTDYILTRPGSGYIVE